MQVMLTKRSQDSTKELIPPSPAVPNDETKSNPSSTPTPWSAFGTLTSTSQSTGSSQQSGTPTTSSTFTQPTGFGNIQSTAPRQAPIYQPPDVSNKINLLPGVQLISNVSQPSRGFSFGQTTAHGTSPFSQPPTFSFANKPTTFGASQQSTSFGGAQQTGFGNIQPLPSSHPPTSFGIAPNPTGFGSTQQTPGFGQSQGFGLGGLVSTQSTGFGPSQQSTFGAALPSFGSAQSSTFGSVPPSAVLAPPTFGFSQPIPFNQTSGGFGVTNNPPSNQPPTLPSSHPPTSFGTAPNPTGFGQSNGFSYGGFGATQPTAFGPNFTHPGGFGNGFGASQQPGFDRVPYAPILTEDIGHGGRFKMVSITAMPNYSSISFEELRKYDYARPFLFSTE
jgi:hypothetical protein